MSRCTCERAVREAVAEKDAEIERQRQIKAELSIMLNRKSVQIDDLTRQLAEERDHRSIAEQALRDMRGRWEITTVPRAPGTTWTSTDSGPADMDPATISPDDKRPHFLRTCTCGLGVYHGVPHSCGVRYREVEL
jgi:hypothetical protein